MPIYEYRCCGKIKEVLTSFYTSTPPICDKCKREMTKAVSKNSFILKGGGWYADGYSAQK